MQKGASLVHYYPLHKTNIITVNPINPNIGYNTPTKLENPALANGIANAQNKAVFNNLFLSLDILFINPNPLANAVVNMAIHRIMA